MPAYKKVMRGLLCAAMCIALLTMPGCEMIEQLLPTEEVPAEPPVDYRLVTAEEFAELETARNTLIAVLPENYTAAIPAPAAYVSSTDVPDSIDTVEQWKLEQYKLMLQPAVDVLITEEGTLCHNVVGEDKADAITAAEQSLRTGFSAVQSLSELYIFVAGVENSIFSQVGVACAAENKESFAVMPMFETDENGDVLLTIFTNFPLPGFEDGTYGYLLRLFVDDGEKETTTVVDSIYSHDHITYRGSHAVTFNLSDILTDTTAQDYLKNRNRVTFTLFARDNSFSYSQEYYKLRYTENGFSGVDDARAAIVEVIFDALG